MGALQRLTHHLRVADALKAVVGAAISELNYGVHHVGARLHLGSEQHRADAGVRTTADVADLVKRRVLADFFASEISGATVSLLKVLKVLVPM